MANFLYTSLQKIMDLKHPLDEAEKKLKNTHMEIDKILYYISGFDFESGRIKTININNGDEYWILPKKSINCFLPPSGIYQTIQGDIIGCIKVPIRQWKKSFSENFYKTIWVTKPTNKSNIIEQLFKATKKEIAISKDQNIYSYYSNSPIGYIEKQHIICTNPHFKQELIDWNKQTCLNQQ